VVWPIWKEQVVTGNQRSDTKETMVAGWGGSSVELADLANQAFECKIVRGNGAAHKLGGAQITGGALVVVEAATAGVDMDDGWIGVGWLLVKRRARGNELQIGSAGAAKAYQNPDRRQAIQIGG
jgi:hypothetical protein